MAAKVAISKRAMITKANKNVVIATSVAAFIVIFCLVASKTLFSQMLYQNRIVSAKKQALSQLKADETAANQLENSYQTFVSTPQNVIGGNPTGTGQNDGDNGKIVLDALPSQYDFPALATSLEKILTSQGVQIQSISGSDDELAQGQQKATANPTSVAMPFQISVTGNYQAITNVVKTFEASIRPIQVQNMTLSGSDASLTLSITAQTYYQPAKTFTIGSTVIK